MVEQRSCIMVQALDAILLHQVFAFLLKRMAAKLAAYNVGMSINRRCHRPDSAFATAIV